MESQIREKIYKLPNYYISEGELVSNCEYFVILVERHNLIDNTSTYYFQNVYREGRIDIAVDRLKKLNNFLPVILEHQFELEFISVKIIRKRYSLKKIKKAQKSIPFITEMNKNSYNQSIQSKAYNIKILSPTNVKKSEK